MKRLKRFCRKYPSTTGGLIGFVMVMTALAVISISACGTHKAPVHAAASSARASAHAVATGFAQSPQTRHDEVVFLNRLAGAENTATQGKFTFRLNTTDMAHPKVVVTHLSPLLFSPFRHPIATQEKALRMVIPKGTWKAFKACWEKLPLPVASSLVQNYLIATAGCASGAPQ